MSWWTTEQVAEHTGLTVEQVYVTRRRKEWPGVLGVRQGRTLRFDSEKVKAGPSGPERTDDPAVAAVWMLEDLRAVARDIRQAVDEVRAWTRQQQTGAIYPAVTWLNMDFTDVPDSDGEPWAVDDDEERADDDSDE